MSIATILGVNFFEGAASRPTSKNSTAQSVAKTYLAWRTTNEVLVNTAFGTLIGTSWDGLPIDTITCTPQGGGVWTCEAKFAFTAPEASENNADDEALGVAYANDLSAGQIHITQSLETISTFATGVDLRTAASGGIDVYPDGINPTDADIGKEVLITGPSPPWTPGIYTIVDVATDVNGAGFWTLNSAPAAVGQRGGVWAAETGPDYRQAIGITKNGIAGTDIYSSKFEFSITVKMFPVTLDFLRVLAFACAKTNNDVWKGFAKNSVLYLGCTGQAQPDGYWTMTHKFAVGQNLTGLVVSPQISLDKKAWEYLWCTYGPANVNGLLLNLPRVAKVERVYDETDFNLLRLNPPVANWNTVPNPPSGMHPLSIQFNDLSTGTPLEWLWDFGDGATSSAQSPVHIYTITGAYTVSLTVTNGAGSSFMTVTNAVVVS